MSQVIRAFAQAWSQSLYSHAPLPPTLCYWHSGCGNIATTDVMHIGVGEVPACESCAYYARPLIRRLHVRLESALRKIWN